MKTKMLAQIDVTKLARPQVQWTNDAIHQLKLITQNDFTLEGKYFRILISGKGCDGFTYSTGFTDKREEDLIIEVEYFGFRTEILMDPFAAFYLQDITVDYVQEHETEGFVIKNHVQEKYAGKFWRGNDELVPPLVQKEI